MKESISQFVMFGYELLFVSVLGSDPFPQVARAGEEVVDRRGGRPPELLGRELRGPLAEDVLGRAAAGGGEA